MAKLGKFRAVAINKISGGAFPGGCPQGAVLSQPDKFGQFSCFIVTIRNSKLRFCCVKFAEDRQYLLRSAQQ